MIFPASPTIGQQFTAAGVTWTWDGAKWLPSGLSPTVVPGINDNRLINGDMRIDQRNNGAATTAQAYILDRWRNNSYPFNKITCQRATQATLPGFPYSFGITTTTPYTVTSGDNFLIDQNIEADMISDFAWGTPSAQPATLSFWVNSSVTGMFGGSIKNYLSPWRCFPFSYSISTPNIWTRVVINIPADTGGAWTLSGNTGAIDVCFGLGVGSTGSGTPGAWVTSTPPLFSATGAVSIVGTSGATFYLTGVKLEIGSVATPYNRQSLAKSMADCQRYYQQLTQCLIAVNGNGAGIVGVAFPIRS